MHTLSGVNHNAANLVLVTIRAALTGAFILCNKSNASQSSSLSPVSRRSPKKESRLVDLTPEQQRMLDGIPRDVRTALSRLKAEPNIVRYATCPTCSQTYAPNPDTPEDPYPRHCTFKETDKPICGTLLVRKVVHVAPSGKRAGRVTYSALRPFPYHPVFSWIASLFTRESAERHVEASWTRSCPSPGAPYTDILQAPALRNFRGPDGALFSAQPFTDVHLVFGLFVDWFNPGGNKQAGKSRSVGAMYLVCLSLPPELRFLPEYMCLLGIIPGPHEPSLHQLNHFLRPLIDEFLILWYSGIRLSRTALHSTGRLVRAVIIPLICDLPALRKTAGFAGHGSKHFCSFCLLKKVDINDLTRPWPSRTWGEHLDIARRWRDAKTEVERDAIFDEHGLRWSELL